MRRGGGVAKKKPSPSQHPVCLDQFVTVTLLPGSCNGKGTVQHRFTHVWWIGFLRGTAVVMAEDVARLPSTGITPGRLR